MINREEHFNKHFGLDYLRLTQGDICSTNSSLRRSVVMYLGCQKPGKNEELVHLTKNLPVCEDAFVLLIKEICPRPRFVLADTAPDFIPRSVPRLKIRTGVSKNFKSLEDYPHNSILTAKKSLKNGGGQQHIYFHSKNSDNLGGAPIELKRIVKTPSHKHRRI
mmetsp:Transcript_18219/g.28555  ORF Transcript_18219/g.28555 Transcript_18219/m.28555 type:complete len:163 (-) Transcript_18219:87-575(-)